MITLSLAMNESPAGVDPGGIGRHYENLVVRIFFHTRGKVHTDLFAYIQIYTLCEDTEMVLYSGIASVQSVAFFTFLFLYNSDLAVFERKNKLWVVHDLIHYRSW